MSRFTSESSPAKRRTGYPWAAMHVDPNLTVTSWGPASKPEPVPEDTAATVTVAASPSTDTPKHQDDESGVSSQVEVLTPTPDPAGPAKPKRRSKAQQIRTARVNPWQANQDPEAVRYFTPPWLLDMIMGWFAQWTGSSTVVDTDPAFDPEAFVRATHAYDIRAGQDGLRLPWWGSTFVNPPYDKPAPWLAKAATRYVTRRTPDGYGIRWYGSDMIVDHVPADVEITWLSPATSRSPAPNEPTGWVDPMDGRAQTVMLVNVAPGTQAWRRHVFGNPDCLCMFFNKRLTFYKRGVGYEGPNNRDSALLYYGPNHAEFAHTFKSLGTMVKSWSGETRPLYTQGSNVEVSRLLPVLTLETAKGHFGWK